MKIIELIELVMKNGVDPNAKIYFDEGGHLVEADALEINENIGKKEIKIILKKAEEAVEVDDSVKALCLNPLKPYKKLKGRSKLPNWIREEIKAASDRKGKPSSYTSLEAVLNSEEDGYRALRLVEWEKDENGASMIADVMEYNAKDLETAFIVKFFSDNANEEEV